MLDDFPMVSFMPLDITDEDSLNDVLLKVDMAMQYGEGLLLFSLLVLSDVVWLFLVCWRVLVFLCGALLPDEEPKEPRDDDEDE